MNEFEEMKDKMYAMAKTDPKVFNTILLQRLGNHILIKLMLKEEDRFTQYEFLRDKGFNGDALHIMRNDGLASIGSILNVCTLLDINFIGIIGVIQSEINAYGLPKDTQSHAQYERVYKCKTKM